MDKCVAGYSRKTGNYFNLLLLDAIMGYITFYELCHKRYGEKDKMIFKCISESCNSDATLRTTGWDGGGQLNDTHPSLRCPVCKQVYWRYRAYTYNKRGEIDGEKWVIRTFPPTGSYEEYMKKMGGYWT